MIRIPKMIKIGPVGSQYGDEWDERGKSEIVQIFISHDDKINSIQFQYYENGTLALSDSYGRTTGYKFDAVKLDHPREYITWVSGYKSSNSGHLISIAFGTNYETYGPFGRFTAHDKEVAFKLGDDRQFGGFHGTADDNCVRSIGVYLKPMTILDSGLGRTQTYIADC
ncbi:Hypothetical predicted protein [Olea europaea subsp. europaea]|uniref:Jacalin-type lectin domain-containing protein n=1 Tax=Olea europaea subsp. europaea TaxID=158383 RepID=A0A8S0TFG8_OLEEU|nr:Hypothetical predicted protein [Olea europaea subsp. europaea]